MSAAHKEQNHFSGPVKVRALKNAIATKTTTQRTAKKTNWERWEGWEGKKHVSPCEFN